MIADSCNPDPVSRRGWHEVGRRAGVAFVDVEVICSDVAEHRRRVEERRSTIPGLVQPTWDQVLARAYVPWTSSRVVIDTAGRTIEASLHALLAELPG